MEEGDAECSRAAWRGRLEFWIGLGVALLVHLALLPNRGFTADLHAFDSWMRAALDYGVAHISEHVWCDYLPGYLYLLKAVGLLWKGATGQPPPPFGSATQQMLLKAIPALADLGGAWVLYRIAGTRLRPAAAAAIGISYALNPAILFNSAVWGQADSVIALLMLLAVWSIGCGRVAAGFAVAAAALMVKPQAVVIVPALALGALYVRGWRALIAAPLAVVLASVVLLLPFFTAGRIGWVLQMVDLAVGHFPVVSMNAHNVWWLVWGKESPHTSDMMRFGNALFSYRALGTIMLGVMTLLVLWRMWVGLRTRPGEPLPVLCEAGALQVLAFYLFPTEMHERYIVPALIFLAATAIWKPRVAWVYALTSATTLLSLACVFPEYTPVLRDSHAVPYAASTVFIALFLVLLMWTPDRRFRDLAPILVLLCASATLGAASISLTAPQRLCDWSPIGWEQGWGRLQIDRSVGGRPLSVGGRTYEHGFGTHAASRISYHLNGAFRIFDTGLGIDDEANHGQKVRFRIIVDRNVLYDSGDLSGPDTLRRATVPVGGAEFLSLQVLDGGDGINSDHADWLDPVLQR